MDAQLQSQEPHRGLSEERKKTLQKMTGEFVKNRLTIDAIKTFGVINIIASVFWCFMLSWAFFMALTQRPSTGYGPRFMLFLGSLLGFYLVSISMAVANVGLLRWHEWARQAVSVLSLVLIGLTVTFHLAKGAPIIKVINYNWAPYLYISLMMSFFNIRRVKRIFLEKRPVAAQDSFRSVLTKSFAVLFFCALAWHLTWNAITCPLRVYRVFLAAFLVFVLLFMNLLVKPRIEE